MKRNFKIMAVLVTAVGLAGSVLAQGMPGCDGRGPMGSGQYGSQARQAGMKFDPAQRAARHLEGLRGQLKITAEQEPLWQAFAEQMQAHSGKGYQAMRAQAADDKLTAPERMAKMQSLMQERLAAMTGTHEHFNRLYAALTPEQKAAADQHFARMGQGRGGKSRGPQRAAPPQG